MREYIFQLRHSPIFTGMSDEEILAVLGCMDAAVRKSARGSYLLRAGDTT